MLDGSQTGDPPLRLAIELFDRLNESGIRYCHWKSNIRLGKSLAGKTDFDILVAEEDLDRLVAIIAELGFRSMINRPERDYEGLSDFLGMDPDTGGLLHIHLHDRLALGSRSGKDIDLPIEAMFLSNLERAGNVPVPLPELELIVLLLRAVLKSKPRGGAEPSGWFPADMVDEVAALSRRCDQQRFSALLKETGVRLEPATLLRLAAGMTGDNPDRGEVSRLREEVLAALAPYRERWTARDWINWGRRKFFETSWAKRNLPARRKRLHETGLCVALIGADGSGKSTHAADLRRWLSWKLLCQQEYLGLPKSSRPYRLLGKISQSLGKRARATKSSVRRLLLQAIAGPAGQARWLSAARSRVRTSRRIERLVRKGAIVICDRYPLAELISDRFAMDGPRIRFESGSGIIGAASLEERWYRNIRRPDLIVVLRTSADVLQQRKAELDAETSARKAALVSGIEASRNIAVVDNDRDYREVHREIRRLIWERL